jgi:hypothetical protein
MAIEDIDIWRSAKILIDAHGENAWLEAAQRADYALEDGNPDGVNVWKRVLRAIEEWRTQPHVGSAPN